jgi:hypothetical protein
MQSLSCAQAIVVGYRKRRKSDRTDYAPVPITGSPLSNVVRYLERPIQRLDQSTQHGDMMKHQYCIQPTALFGS